MKYTLRDLIDIEQFQNLQDRLNTIYPFPSAIIDNAGNILTATAWQDICTKFHRKNRECERDCIKSDQYILSHLHKANPAVSYKCPRGLVDNAMPIIIDGVHYGNFFTGQFFLKKPDLKFFRKQAQQFGFDEKAYLAAVKKVPVWSRKQLNNYLLLIKELIAVISDSGLKRLIEIQAREQIEANEKQADAILRQTHDGFWITAPPNGKIMDVNDAICRMLGYSRDEMLKMAVADVEANDSPEVIAQRIQQMIQTGSANFESRFRRKDGTVIDADVSVTYMPSRGLFFGFHRDISERKRAEEALRDSETKFRAVFESSMDAIGVSKRGVHVFVNPAYRALFGYSDGELIGKSILDLIAPACRDQVIQNVGQRAQGEPAPSVYETRGLRKDGTEFEMDVHVSTYESGGEVFAVAHLRDISEHKRAEAERRLQTTIAQNVAEGVYLVSQKDLTIVYANPVMEKMFGCDPGEMIGKPVSIINALEGGDPEQTARQIEAALLQTGVYRGEVLTVRKDGTSFWSHTTISMMHHPDYGDVYVSLQADITARKQAEESLRASTAKLETLIQISPIAVVLVDADGNVQLWNATAEKTFGWSAREVIGYPNPIVPADKRSEYDAWSTKVLQGKSIINRETVRQRKDGSLVNVSISSVPVYDAAGKVVGRMATIADITEQNRQQAQLLETQAELQRLLDEAEQSRRVLLSAVEDQKLAEDALRQLNAELEQRVAERTAQLQTANQELEAFTYSVSHDLRAPLRAIDGYARILLEDYGPQFDAEGTRLFNAVRTNAQKMDQLITDLLALSRATRGELNRARVDMTALARAICHENAPSGVPVILSLAELPAALGDAALLRQVWSNLISNAVKFTQPKAEPRIEIGGYTQDDQNVYYVKDNGVGFNPDYAHKLFGVFQRLHKAEEFDGTGVGLAIVQRIVQRHGGKTWAEGWLGEGATFYFSIPCEEVTRE